jgi:excisionase family DNA binding protein
MTLEEAADFLRLPVNLLLRRAREGLIPGARIGRAWRFSHRLLLEWLENASISEELVEEGLARLIEERVAAGRPKIPLAQVKERFGL